MKKCIRYPKKLSLRRNTNEMKYAFERHILNKNIIQRKGRKVKLQILGATSSIRNVLYETVTFFTRREEGEQMSLRPTSGSKSPRRKISSRAYF